jgi:3-oxoacyl-[acyl-carrier protein] reductase
MNELAGKVAIVTGSARNIGRAIALDMARGGAAVVVNGRTLSAEAKQVVDEIEAIGGRAVALAADVADPEQAAGLVAGAVDRLGRLDILVNNAALRRETPLTELSLEEWHRVLSIVLDGAFLLAKAAIPHLKQAGGGSIVNIGGLSAHTGAALRAHVVTAKAGLVGLTRALAHELAPIGVTVNCVVPGTIDTVRRDEPPRQLAHQAARKPVIERNGKPEEIAALVRMLCGPGARYTTGQSLHVNGGALMP